MVRTKQTGLIKCLLYGYKRANELVGNICGPYRKLWTVKPYNKYIYMLRKTQLPNVASSSPSASFSKLVD